MLDQVAIAGAGKTTSESELTARWVVLSAAQPESREDVEAFVAASVSTKTVHIGSQHIHGEILIGSNRNAR